MEEDLEKAGSAGQGRKVDIIDIFALPLWWFAQHE
jgi:hypothetical protein